MNSDGIPCLIHIPVLYPDGTPVCTDLLNLIFEVLDRHFGGSSSLGEIDGRWLGIAEPMLRVEVSVPRDKVPRFELIARQIGKATKQAAVYIVINWQATAKTLLILEDDDGDLRATGGGA